MEPGSMIPPDRESRYRGALLGLAAGDAVGTTLEFRPPGTFRRIDDMVGGGPFDLKPGHRTDDTSMALCLAESLVETGGLDAADQLHRYVRWWREGHHSRIGRCFDIGNTVREALHAFLEHGDPARSGATHEHSAGNGSLMRLAPRTVVVRARSGTGKSPWRRQARGRRTRILKPWMRVDTWPRFAATRR
jgi:ADP-ribosyl-[dinitrogen reductase] hydrolase